MMIPSQNLLEPRTSVPVLFTLLPGPDRKRTMHPYRYRLAYRTPDPAAPGCLMLWEVAGGRLLYQIAVERDDADQLHLHCTCADAVFRGETEGRYCKHLRGLLEFGRSPSPEPPLEASRVPTAEVPGPAREHALE